ncbi:MAG: metalloregulator ArsR/SmtB family transcription factor, partial [Pseudomonadota bacterium]
MDRTDTTPDVFAALADGHRRQILGWLREGPLSVGQLVERLPLSQPGVTKHLGVLERAGLI